MSLRNIIRASIIISLTVALLSVNGYASESSHSDLSKMNDFALSYTRAWSSQDPASVAAHYAENGSLRINENEPSVGRDQLRATAKSFMTELPDMVLTMDELTFDGERYIYRWALRGTNTGPGGTGNTVHISGYEEWIMNPEGLIQQSRGHMDMDDYAQQLSGGSQTSSTSPGGKVKLKLLVLAGAADPASPLAERRFRMVCDEAMKRGYDMPQVVPWPGQISAGGGDMDLLTASAQLTRLLGDLESEGKPYDVIAFSWGASVYLYTLSQMEAPVNLRNTVLWGIDEFWRLSEYFLTKESTEAIGEAIRKGGASLSSEFYAHQVPNEVMLRDYPHSNPIRIGFGGNDSQSPPAFAAYLKSFVNKPNITYKVIPEVGHIVGKYHQGYLDCLFGGFE